MSLRLNGSTSGYTEIDAPAVAGSNTLVLPTGNGSSGQFLQTNGSGTLSFASAVVNGSSSAIVSGTAVASTSGTSIDFTGIPSWVKRVTLMFSGVSTSGSSNKLVQIGAGSIDSTGYVSSSMIFSTGGSNGNNATTGYIISSDLASFTITGHLIITLLGSNLWISSHSIGSGAAATGLIAVGGGNKTLSGTLDRVRITTVNGTDTFDAGSINILYE
jgi:hypothetical protein